MTQVYIPYWEWEDWINGMWRKLPKDEEHSMIEIAIEFTGDYKKYGQAMIDVSTAWPKTMINSLSNMSINRRAFIGHCAAQYAINSPEYITRIAWHKLDTIQQYKANGVADMAIKKWGIEYERQNKRLYKNMGRQMLFQWDS